ncbi:MAG: hypothetical protein H6741_27330 [Alphaproteobacteria bacterium]|nr:hypothetical protein [Alphaproteobacteria bacterium]MCB9796426.1 hypothetical protein [Alphaproteobacteria bacterium]
MAEPGQQRRQRRNRSLQSTTTSGSSGNSGVSFNTQPGQHNSTGTGSGQETTQGTNALKRNLGEVSDLNGFNDAVGEFLNGLTAGDDDYVAVSFSATLAIPVNAALSVDFKVSFDAKYGNEGGNKKLTGSLGLRAGATVHLYFTELKAGVAFTGSVAAAGDSGQECADLIGLSLLPAVQGKSQRLADALFGGAKAYSDRVIKGMDPRKRDNKTGKLEDLGSGEADYVETSWSIGGYGSVEATDLKGNKEVGADLEMGYKNTTTTFAVEDGKGNKSKDSETKDGFYLNGELDIAATGSKGKLEFDEAGGQLVLTASQEFTDPGKMAWLNQVGTLMRPLIKQGINLLREKKLTKVDPETAATSLLAQATTGALVVDQAELTKMGKVNLLFELSFKTSSPASMRFKVKLENVLDSGKIKIGSKRAGGEMELKVTKGMSILDTKDIKL